MGHEEERSEIRDRREASWFWMDKAVIDAYGPHIGAIGVAVYTALARWADKDAQAKPSFATLARKLGISRRCVIMTIERLRFYGLVAVHRRQHPRGVGFTSNCYTLLPVDPKFDGEPAFANEITSDTTLVQKGCHPSAGDEPGEVNEVHHPSAGGAPKQEVSEQELFEQSFLNNPPLPPRQGGVRQGTGTPFTRKAPKRKQASSFPEDPAAQDALKSTVLTDTLRAWVQKKNLHHFDLEQEWDAFSRKAGARGWMYKDWYMAFQNWLTSPYQQLSRTLGAGSNGRAPTEDFATMSARIAREIYADELPAADGGARR